MVDYTLAAIQQSRPATFGINAIEPSLTNPHMIMQRADEVDTIQRMLSNAQTSVVVLTGDPGAGKSTLAALLYHRLLLAKQQGLPTQHHFVWLGVSEYTTVPDMLAAILSKLNVLDDSFFLLKPEQQVAALLGALRRQPENALIILDQFETLLQSREDQEPEETFMLPLFLEMLQTDLGTSRVLLTCSHSPYDENLEETRVRSCLISRISLPEGVALLQQRGVQGSPEEFSLIWQRCSGHVFALVLFAALLQLSGIALSYFLNSPEMEPLWAGDVMMNLVATIYHYLNPIQYSLIRALSLFHEPVPLQGVLQVTTGSSEIEADVSRRFELEMAALVQLGLVQVVRNKAGTTCFSLHPAQTQYILEHFLDRNDQRLGRGLASLGVSSPLSTIPTGPEATQVAVAASHMQVASYYQQMAREQCPAKKQRTCIQDVEPLIFTICHLALGWHWQEACDLLFEEGLHESMVQWGACHVLIKIYVSLLPPLGVINRRDQGRVYSQLAMLYGRVGDYDQGRHYIEEALAIQRQLHDTRGEATTFANLGELCRMRNEYNQAHVCFERALALSKEVQDALLQCIVQHNLGLLAHQEKDYKQAYISYQEALTCSYQLPGSQGQYYSGMILTNLGMLLYEQGMRTEGLSILLGALKLRQTLQDSSAVLLDQFLKTLAQKLGQDAYVRIRQKALEMQPEVFSRFVTPSVRE